MKIITKHNRSTVTFVEEIHPGGSKAPGVMLDILGSDSDDDDMSAYAWLSAKEAERLAFGLLELVGLGSTIEAEGRSVNNHSKI